MNKKALLHLANEFAPVFAFFITAQLYSFYIATAVLIGATLLALFLGWHYGRKLPVLPIISGVFVIISGIITLINQSPNALIFADSLYYFLMCFTLAIGLLFKVNILKKIFENTFAVSDRGWFLLGRRWVLIFFLAGVANEIARLSLTPEDWVTFKVFKVVAITLIGTYQFTLARRYRLPEVSNEWGLKKD